MDEFVGVSPSADRDGDSARGDARGRSGALSEGLLTDPLGRRGVKLDEACAGHGSQTLRKRQRVTERERENGDLVAAGTALLYWSL